MKRSKTAAILMLALLALPVPTSAALSPDLSKYLPRGAEVVGTTEADLTGDGRPEIIVGYKLDERGHSAVLERTRTGSFRRYDLEGVWPPRVPPRLTVQDVTGDGRPELVRISAGGAAFQMLFIFQRTPGGGYRTVLIEPGMNHLLWDIDGDGVPEVLSQNKIDFPGHHSTASFRWLGDRFLTWHTARWFYGAERHRPKSTAPVPNLIGLTASEAADRTTRQLGMIVPVDSPAPAGQVVAQRPQPGSTAETRTHLAVSAGSTQFVPGTLPDVWDVTYSPAQNHDLLGVPAGSSPSQRQQWAKWLHPLLKGARQIVHTHGMNAPAYIFHLHDPWTVSVGGRWLSVRMVGVSLEPTNRGLLFLAEKGGDYSPLWPDFTTAIYTTADVAPPAPPMPKPLKRYLKANPELEAFLTLAPESWTEAVRLRGIQPDGWPAPESQPPFRTDQTSTSAYTPMPDHAIVTVLNGRVKAARQQGGNIWIDLKSVPGQAQRWILPLNGMPMGGTPDVTILGPEVAEFALHTSIPIGQWSGPPPTE